MLRQYLSDYIQRTQRTILSVARILEAIILAKLFRSLTGITCVWNTMTKWMESNCSRFDAYTFYICNFYKQFPSQNSLAKNQFFPVADENAKWKFQFQYARVVFHMHKIQWTQTTINSRSNAIRMTIFLVRVIIHTKNKCHQIQLVFVLVFVCDIALMPLNFIYSKRNFNTGSIFQLAIESMAVTIDDTQCQN